MPQRYTPSEEQQTFLAALSAGYSVTGAAQRAGVCRVTPYRWRQRSAPFAREWDAAWAAGADALEDAALARAVSGVKKPVYRGGELVGHVTEFSDTMLMQLLKARKPEKYGGGTPKDAPAPDMDIEGARDALFRKFRAVAEPERAAEVPDVADRA